MKKITFLIFILFLSCNDKQKQCDVEHTVYEKANNGKEVVKTIRDCDNTVGTMYQILRISDDSVVRDGYYKEYYPSGKLKMLGFFKNGLQDSSTIVFRESGIKEVENYFVDGKVKGLQSEFYNNGHYKSRCYYANDTMRTFCVFYDTNGQIEKFEGRAITAFYDKDIDKIKLGEKVFIANEIPPLDGIEPVFTFSIYYEDSKKFVNSFETRDLSDHIAIYKAIKFKPEKKGKYQYSAMVTLIDKKSKLKTDTISFPIIVR